MSTVSVSGCPHGSKPSCWARLVSEGRLLIFPISWSRHWGRPYQAISGDPGCPEHAVCRCDRGVGRVDGVQRRARSYSLGQRAGIYGPGCAQVAWTGGSQDALYRAWVSGENGLRVSTGSLGTTCWTERSSIPCWRCVC